MALAVAQTLAITGTTPAYNTPLASENVIPASNLWLHVKNGNASPCVVTVDDPGFTPAGSVPVDPSVSVPATTGDRMIPLPLPFVNASTGFINVTFSIQTTVTAAVLRLP